MFVACGLLTLTTTGFLARAEYVVANMDCFANEIDFLACDAMRCECPAGPIGQQVGKPALTMLSDMEPWLRVLVTIPYPWHAHTFSYSAARRQGGYWKEAQRRPDGPYNEAVG